MTDIKSFFIPSKAAQKKSYWLVIWRRRWDSDWNWLFLFGKIKTSPFHRLFPSIFLQRNVLFCMHREPRFQSLAQGLQSSLDCASKAVDQFPFSPGLLRKDKGAPDQNKPRQSPGTQHPWLHHHQGSSASMDSQGGHPQGSWKWIFRKFSLLKLIFPPVKIIKF